MFRRKPIRSRALLDSAKGAPCTMQVPGVCNRDWSTTVSAHLHDDGFGMAEKADDCSTAHLCSACHAWLDQGHWLGKVSEAEMLRLVLRALQRTLRYRIEHKFMRIDLDKEVTFHDRPVKPRKPKDERAKVPAGRKLEGQSNWPKGRRIPSKNNPRPH